MEATALAVALRATLRLALRGRSVVHLVAGLVVPSAARASVPSVYSGPPSGAALRFGIATLHRRTGDARLRRSLAKVRGWFALRAGMRRRAVSSSCSVVHIELRRLAAVAAPEQNWAMSFKHEWLFQQVSLFMRGLTSAGGPVGRARPNE